MKENQPVSKMVANSHILSSLVAEKDSIAEDARVRELIDKNTRWWNISLIHEVFQADESATICQMHASPYYKKDQLVWIGTSNGEFSVRSAYHLEERNSKGNGECSQAFVHGNLWKRIW